MTNSHSVLGPIITQLFNRAEVNPGKVCQHTLGSATGSPLTVLVKQTGGDGRFRIGLMRPDVYPSMTEAAMVTADLPLWVSSPPEWGCLKSPGKFYLVTWVEKTEYLMRGKG